MFLLDDAVVTSASDLTTASKCEFAFARQLDTKLGRIDRIVVAEDPMLKRAGRLGDEHEDRQLEKYRAEGLQIAEIERPASMTRDDLRIRAAETIAAFASGAEVVFQATFFDETDPGSPFIGFADFIVRMPDGRYRVQDTKLARSVKVVALLQLAAYHQQLTRLGIPADDTVELILGDGTIAAHDVHEILPVYRNRRARILAIVGARLADTTAVAWGDPDYTIDGRCDHCAPEVVASRDLLMVAGLRVSQRAKLIAAGITTIDDFAATPARPDSCDLAVSTYAQLQAQAALQAALQASAIQSDDPHAAPPFVLYAPSVIGDLPAPDPGDIYFDFEGDPLHLENEQWGIDYLFGLVDDSEQFKAFWAHDLAAEKQALLDFLDYAVARRITYPRMHIYHYASYERTHLLSIAARHGVGEHIVDDLLRDGVLVDLYSTVKKSLRVGGPSYSIKKLEPLYMGAEHRADDGVTNAAASIEEYERAMEAGAAGDEAEAQKILDTIADYNEYDCVSTRRLRNWLLAQAAKVGVTPGAFDLEDIDGDPFVPSALNLELLKRSDTDDIQDARAHALAAAAIDYHRRENKSYWWEHFARLTEPMDLWADTRGVFMIESVTVEADWGRTGKQRNDRRRLRAVGTWAPGSGTPKGDAFVLYGQPTPFRKKGRRPGSLLDHGVTITADVENGVVWIDEVCPTDEDPWSDLPLALTPGPPPKAASIVAAIEEWGWSVVDLDGEWPRDAASDILTARPPRGAGLEPMRGPDDSVRAVTQSLLGLDNSYLAVQGPPGTGKTYLAAHVITALVRDHGWRIGVVAQSHKVVENVLRKVVDAGLPPGLVAKVPGGDPGSYVDEPFTELPKDGQAGYAARASGGYVIGGTAWDFTNLKRVTRRQLDLLVIDEAGQFSLAATIGVAMSAKNVLLLGDPQQLPQVSQGTHPAPVDQSALGYIAGGHPVLPAELGYFLADSRRMHPDVTLPVSRLAYEGALHSHPSTSNRHLADTAAGLHPVSVDHVDNATESVEEAAAVVELVRAHLGREWSDPQSGRVADPLRESDIIVVTPYNAQLELLRKHLDAAGFAEVPVGTVDKFQGQEAVISIVSLAASSPGEVPRGLSFLLSANRLNVAISRAQWAAYLVYSPQLIEHLPHTPDAVAELSRFIELVGK
ncbi:TM0106 family RecB-like putative nuclease [Salinibacterium sp. G-O1]|uniref:TM0106 family RecB-like putative nuclease n=1 Tax=Salinibacterium sp. G-O1 TaxID=3046208 RepID=UPI0024BB9A16|nr:bifunctional RecB family nuclease/DEAD/DEAH box helicase [Salinibacterium sp. G-O1]MDJ0336027.1 TM0106 family RecB-like putative nuclease [Salinibacterium sp. G-O1]